MKVKVKRVGTRRHQIQASPTFGGPPPKQRSKKKATKGNKKINPSQVAKKILSGWSTDRHSINTESAIELFENSVLAKNMAIKNREEFLNHEFPMNIKDEVGVGRSASQTRLTSIAEPLPNRL